MVRVDLLPHVPKYREDAFSDLFKPADAPDKGPSTHPANRTPDSHRWPSRPTTAAADPGEGDGSPRLRSRSPVQIVFEGIRERATILPIGISAERPVISPDSKTVIFAAHLGAAENLYSYSLDELALEPPSPVQVTST